MDDLAASLATKADKAEGQRILAKLAAELERRWQGVNRCC